MPNNTGVVFICKPTNGQLIQRIVELIAIIFEAFLNSRKKAPNNTLIKNIFFPIDLDIVKRFEKNYFKNPRKLILNF